MRRFLSKLPASESVLTIFSMALVSGVAIEIVFARLLARAGIYVFQGNPAAWLYPVYNSLVWLGSAALNFATILSPILLLVLFFVLWQQKRGVSRMLSVVLLVAMGLEGSLFLVSSNPALALAYLGSSIILVALAAVFFWRRGEISRVALTLVPLLTMFLSSYWYKAVPLIHQLGGAGIVGSVTAFHLGEVMLVLLAISLPVTIGISRSPKVLAGSVLPPLFLIGIYLGNPGLVPLISTWAFGITLYLPFWTYILALWCASVAVLTMLERGHLLLACALILLFSSHRMLPLTYFNNLTLSALMLIMVTSWRTSKNSLRVYSSRGLISAASAS